MRTTMTAADVGIAREGVGALELAPPVTEREAQIDIPLILVVGPPRTGTTLLGFLLGGGEGVFSLSEPFILYQLWKRRSLRWFFYWTQFKCRMKFRRVPDDCTAAEFLHFLKEMTYENGLTHLTIKETFHEGDLPEMWRNAKLLGQLKSLADYTVGITRHPFDAASSMFKLFYTLLFKWQKHILRRVFPYSPRFETTDDLVRWTANNWVYYATWAREHALPVVRYEDLVAEPEKSLQWVCDQVGLQYHDGMLNPQHKRAAFAGVGDPAVIWRPRGPRPVHSESVGRGKNLSEAHRDIIREICGETAAEYDYDLSSDCFADNASE